MFEILLASGNLSIDLPLIAKGEWLCVAEDNSYEDEGRKVITCFTNDEEGGILVVSSCPDFNRSDCDSDEEFAKDATARFNGRFYCDFPDSVDHVDDMTDIESVKALYGRFGYGFGY